MDSLEGKPIVVYDLETKNAVGGEIGWTNYDKMGISVGCAFDYRTGDYNVYMDDNMEQLVGLLNEAELVVGFNHKGFDNNLLRGMGYSLKPDSELFNYDILEEARKAIGWVPGMHYPKGLKLDNLLEATFGRDSKKTEDGALAPVLYQQRKLGRLITYNVGDTNRTRRIFERIWHGQPILSPVHGDIILAQPLPFMKGKSEIMEKA